MGWKDLQRSTSHSRAGDNPGRHRGYTEPQDKDSSSSQDEELQATIALECFCQSYGGNDLPPAVTSVLCKGSLMDQQSVCFTFKQIKLYVTEKNINPAWVVWGFLVI